MKITPRAPGSPGPAQESSKLFSAIYFPVLKPDEKLCVRTVSEMSTGSHSSVAQIKFAAKLYNLYPSWQQMKGLVLRLLDDGRARPLEEIISSRSVSRV